MGRRTMQRVAIGVCVAAGLALLGCSSGTAGGTKFSSNGQYYFVAPEHAGFSRPQMAAGDSVAWSLHRHGTFSPSGTAFADAPVE